MLFKSELNTNAEQIKEFIPVSAAVDFDRVKPFIDDAERDYLVPAIGADIYNKLIAGGFDSSGSGAVPVSVGDKAVALARRAVINIAFYLGFDSLNSAMGASGFYRTESETQRGLYKYQEENIKERFKSAGFNGIDTLLAHLEENVEFFPEFYESDEFTVISTSIVPDTKTFNKIFFINNSRLVYKRMAQYMQIVEDVKLPAAMGDDFYNEVREKLFSRSPDEKYKALLPYLQKIIVHRAVAIAIFELGVNITDREVFYLGLAGGFPDSSTKKNIGNENAAQIAERANETADSYLAKLKKMLLADAEAFANFKGEGSNYLHNRDNANKKTYWT